MTPGTSSDAAVGNSSNPADDDASSSIEVQQTFCYCHGPEEGDMIAFDNAECTVEWFHITYLQMERLPRLNDTVQIAEYYHSFKYVEGKVYGIDWVTVL